MPLSDLQIIEAIDNGQFFIDPFDKDSVQPSSIDLHLGQTILKITGTEPLDITKDNKHRYEAIDLSVAPFVLQPGQFVLGTASEYIKMGPFCATVHTRSSFARMGLVVTLSSYANPGYEGTLPLPIINLSGVPVTLWPHVRVAQLVLHEVGEVGQMYGARKDAKYMGERGALPSKAHLDREITEFLEARGIKDITEETIEEFQRSVRKRLGKYAVQATKRLTEK